MWSAVELLMDSLKTNRQTGIPLRLERAVTQYGDFQFA